MNKEIKEIKFKKIEDQDRIKIDFSNIGTYSIGETKTIGGYNVSGSTNNFIRFNLSKKPNIIHRFFCKILLGWIWIDNKDK